MPYFCLISFLFAFCSISTDFEIRNHSGSGHVALRLLLTLLPSPAADIDLLLDSGRPASITSIVHLWYSLSHSSEVSDRVPQQGFRRTNEINLMRARDGERLGQRGSTAGVVDVRSHTHIIICRASMRAAACDEEK